MGRVFAFGGVNGDSEGFKFIGTIMNSTVKSYLYFLAFLAVTKIVVTPIIKPMGIPLLSDAL